VSTPQTAQGLIVICYSLIVICDDFNRESYE
jgi:hypothetical protein